MNSRQAQQYARGQEIAKRDALTVVAHGTRKSDGAAVYCVPSRRSPGQWHIIVVEGANLVCTCEAAKHGRYCAHRAAVRDRILLEGQLRREAHEREIERAFHAAARALNVKLDATPARGPKPRTDTRIFSLYK